MRAGQDMRSPAPLRVAFLPPPNAEDPAGFLGLLSSAVEAAGARRVATSGRGLRWSLTEKQADVIHLHWLEYVATSDPAPLIGWARTWLRVARLLAVLMVLRARRIGIVWTIHNLSPHEPARPRAEAALTRAVYLIADEIIVHSEYARRRVRARFRGRRGQHLTVIPHANYAGAFRAEPRSWQEVRSGLGIPEDAFVYLAFGIIRRYKRLDLLIEQFSRLEGDHLRLVIAGTPSPPAEADALRALARSDPRVVLRAEYVPDERVSGLHLASDAAVLAYPDVFSSGALLLALTHGVPVVAPGEGAARELFTPPAVEFFENGSLVDALARVRTGDRREAARRAAARFPWSQAARATVEVYRRAARRDS